MSSYKKEDIAKDLSLKTGFPVNYSKSLINDLIESMINQISKSNLNLKNFGVFKTIKKNERSGRNPKTKEKFTISSRNSIKFTPSKNFKNYINYD